MPFARRGSRRFSGRRRPRRSAYRRPTLARRVRRLTRTVARLPRVERKHVDTLGATIQLLNNFTPANCIFPLRTITVGDSDYAERIGDKLSMSSYQLNMSLILAQGVAYDIVRIIVLQFKYNPDGATSNTSFVNMYFNSATDNTQYNPLALVDWDNSGAFRKLYDKSITVRPNVSVGATPTPAAAGTKHSLRIRFPKVAKQVQFFNSGFIPCRNELFVLITSRSDTATTMEYTDRLVYTDA